MSASTLRPLLLLVFVLYSVRLGWSLTSLLYPPSFRVKIVLYAPGYIPLYLGRHRFSSKVNNDRKQHKAVPQRIIMIFCCMTPGTGIVSLNSPPKTAHSVSIEETRSTCLERRGCLFPRVLRDKVGKRKPRVDSHYSLRHVDNVVLAYFALHPLQAHIEY